MQAMSEVKAMLQNQHCRAQLRSQAVKVFNTLGEMHIAFDTGDDVLTPAHRLKTEWNNTPLTLS